MKPLSERFKHIIINLCFLIALLNSSQKLFAQQIFKSLPENERPHIKATKTTEHITIDGVADEAAWQNSPVATHFITAYPKQGKKSTFETEVKVLYDDKNIYISAKCNFPPGKKLMQVQNMSRDFGFTNNELFEVLIDPFKDSRQPVMTFCVTPYGTQMDIMHYADGSYDYNWNTIWKAESQIQDHSWTTEIAIPFSSLRFPENATEWSINFVRNIRFLGELSGWSAWPLAFNESRMEYAGIITGIQPPKQQSDLTVNPYALANSTAASNRKTSIKPETGGEVNYSINNTTQLEATVNTDFSQADADAQVVNLTRSSVFFPEKRQFFLENSNLFSVGQNGIIQPFFSRRIGLSDAGVPLTINGGLRLVHKDSKQSMGFLLMKQNGDTTETGAVFGVFRYKRNISNKLTLGGMAVLRENQGGHNQPAYLNSVGVADAFWRVDPSLFIRGMTSFSNNTLTHQKGSAAFSEINYSDNALGFDWFETIVTKGYQAQTGYLARDNFINTQPSLGLTMHKDWFPASLAFFYPQVSANIYHQASSGIFQEATVNFIPFQLLFNNLSTFNINITSSWENLPTNFVPVRKLNIGPGNYQYNRYEIYYLSNQGAHISLETKISTGNYYNGNLNSYYFSFRAAPIPNVSLILSYTRDDFKNIGTTLSSTSTHLFAPQVRLAPNSKIQLSAFYQYNTDARNGSLNARMSWEYRPLSFVYLVYNDVKNLYPTPFGIPQQQQTCILKLTYIHQL